MIYGNMEPHDWRDLQNKVAQIFRDIGYSTEVEKKIVTARGTVEVDVYAIDTAARPNRVFICECKNWNVPVPQTIVHAFRTIIVDYGANDGYLISKRGFQSGAIEAVKNTNIKLLSWHEFQELFKDQWRSSMIRILDEVRSILFRYCNPEHDDEITEIYMQMPQDKKELYRDLMLIRYDSLALYTESHYMRKLLDSIEFPADLRKSTKIEYALGEALVNSEKEIFEILIECVERGISEFDRLVGRELR